MAKKRSSRPPHRSRAAAQKRAEAVDPTDPIPPWREGSEDQLEGRNVVLEALRAGRPVRGIWIDERARPEERLSEICSIAQRRGAPIAAVARRFLDRHSCTGVHNGVLARGDLLSSPTVSQRLDEIYEAGEVPFFVLVDELAYEQNLGAILRTCEAAGVHALVLPGRRSVRLSPVAQRVAMGAAERVPVIRSGLMAALSDLRRAGVRAVAADAGSSTNYSSADLTGPIALVLGGEDKGVTRTVTRKCDEVVSIPMMGHLNSLNVSVSAALMIYERVRQEAG